jgi:hypothetical protein
MMLDTLNPSAALFRDAATFSPHVTLGASRPAVSDSARERWAAKRSILPCIAGVILEPTPLLDADGFGMSPRFIALRMSATVFFEMPLRMGCPCFSTCAAYAFVGRAGASRDMSDARLRTPPPERTVSICFAVYPYRFADLLFAPAMGLAFLMRGA